MPSAPSPCLEAALSYLERDWSVLPLCSGDHQGMSGQHEKTCRSPGKAPLCPWKDYQGRRPRPVEVRLWWNRWPTANVGMALGPVSKLIGLDIDGSAGEFLLSFLMRRADVPTLPPTLEFVTPGGGRRLLFQSDEDLPNEEYQLGDGELRLLCEGRQTVMPPSRHANGGEYLWVEGHRPGEIEPAALPEWLLHLLSNQKGTRDDDAVRDNGTDHPHLLSRGSAGHDPHSRGGPGLSPARTSGPRVGYDPQPNASALSKEERARRYLKQMGPCHPEADHPMDASQHLLKAATAMWGLDFDEDEAVQLLAEWDRDNAVTPYPEKELRRKYQQSAQHCGNPRGFLLSESNPVTRDGRPVSRGHSANGQPDTDGAGNTAQSKPRLKRQLRRLPPYRPFPLEALPYTIQEYVRQAGLSLGCDPAYVALPALAVVASVIGNTRTIRLRRGWEEPSIVWSLILGDSGTLKTPAYLRAVSRLFAVQDQFIQQYKADWKKFKDSQDEAELTPGLKRVVCSDTTVERLAEILEDNPRGLLVARDELSGWLGSFTRYKGRGGGTDLPNWLEMHRAGTIVVDRKNRRESKGYDLPVYVRGAAVSVTGSIQPGVLARALTSDFLEAGLAARFLMAMPPKSPKRWSELEIHPDVEEGYNRTLNCLLDLTFDSRHEQRRPYAVDLSGDGKAVWAAFYDEWANEQAAAEGDLASAYSKLEGYAARFALLHHVSEWATRDDDGLVPVEPESIRAGIALCRWFSEESRRIYGTFSESAEDRATRRLVEFIEARGGKITARELMRGNCRRYPDAETAEAALAELVEAALGRWVEEKPDGRGRPTKVFELCMTHDTDDTDVGENHPEAHDTNDTIPKHQ